MHSAISQKYTACEVQPVERKRTAKIILPTLTSFLFLCFVGIS